MSPLAMPVPAPSGSSPPTSGAAPPGAPPGGLPFESALADHLARTAQAEGREKEGTTAAHAGRADAPAVTEGQTVQGLAPAVASAQEPQSRAPHAASGDQPPQVSTGAARTTPNAADAATALRAPRAQAPSDHAVPTGPRQPGAAPTSTAGQTPTQTPSAQVGARTDPQAPGAPTFGVRTAPAPATEEPAPQGPATADRPAEPGATGPSTASSRPSVDPVRPLPASPAAQPPKDAPAPAAVVERPAATAAAHVSSLRAPHLPSAAAEAGTSSKPAPRATGSTEAAAGPAPSPGSTTPGSSTVRQTPLHADPASGEAHESQPETGEGSRGKAGSRDSRATRGAVAEHITAVRSSGATSTAYRPAAAPGDSLAAPAHAEPAALQSDAMSGGDAGPLLGRAGMQEMIDSIRATHRDRLASGACAGADRPRARRARPDPHPPQPDQRGAAGPRDRRDPGCRPGAGRRARRAAPVAQLAGHLPAASRHRLIGAVRRRSARGPAAQVKRARPAGRPMPAGRTGDIVQAGGRVGDPPAAGPRARRARGRPRLTLNERTDRMTTIPSTAATSPATSSAGAHGASSPTACWARTTS